MINSRCLGSSDTARPYEVGIEPCKAGLPLGERGCGHAGLINTVRDGLSVTDGRFPNGAFATTVLNPDMVGEIRLILTPVDAEVGRGNGQVQITTRSGGNRFSGAAVWSVRNSALDANTWSNNRNIDPLTGLWSPTVPNWENQHQLTFSYGGPIIRNKTFFFGLFDRNFVRTRQTVNGTVLTDTARQGIFRYFDGWTPDDADATPGATSRPAVDFQGNPLSPARDPLLYTGRGRTVDCGPIVSPTPLPTTRSTRSGREPWSSNQPWPSRVRSQTRA